MLSSIHPLGERARNNRWWITISAFVVGTTLTGAGVGAGLGWLGSFLPLEDGPRLLGAATAILVAGVLDLAKVRAHGPERQVNERWIGTYRGWVYGAGFGAQLGAGVATFVVTWGVYATFLAEVLSGSAAVGAAIGSVFGFSRAIAPLASRWIDRPSRLTAFHQRMARLGRPVHIGAATVLVAIGLLGVIS